jgi:hypothetical protein
MASLAVDGKKPAPGVKLEDERELPQHACA